MNVLTPKRAPDPLAQEGWCWPDSEDGILSAVEQGATHLWANTILFGSHPLQTSVRLNKHEEGVHVIGQPPLLVERFDDKSYLNNLLRARGSLTLPRSWTIDLKEQGISSLQELNLPFPIVGKPIRGRGSHGVKVCNSFKELASHLESLAVESPLVMLEEYLAGEEATITVMPPSSETPHYWAMPVVARFNHMDGVAPYNGVVAVTANSRALMGDEISKDPRYAEVVKECETVATLLCAKAPIRIDVRRFTKAPSSKFCLFDINMKPVSYSPSFSFFVSA